MHAAMSSKFAALEAQLLDATQGGDLLRVRARPPRRSAMRPDNSARARVHCSGSATATRTPWLRSTQLSMYRGLPQMHRLLLNNEHAELVNALLEGGTRTALHVAVERSNEAAVALLLAQCVLRARAHSVTGWPLRWRAAKPDAPRAVRSLRSAKRTPPRPTRTARARWNLHSTATPKASSSC